MTHACVRCGGVDECTRCDDCGVLFCDHCGTTAGRQCDDCREPTDRELARYYAVADIDTTARAIREAGR